MNAFRKKTRWLIFGGLLSTILAVSLAWGAPPQKTASTAEMRAVEIARLRFKLYERVDYPLRVRQLRSEIKLMEARVASLRRRVKELERFSLSNALFTEKEHRRLELLAVELQVKDAKHELTLLQIHHRDERRLRQLLIENAERLQRP